MIVLANYVSDLDQLCFIHQRFPYFSMTHYKYNLNSTCRWLQIQDNYVYGFQVANIFITISECYLISVIFLSLGSFLLINIVNPALAKSLQFGSLCVLIKNRLYSLIAKKGATLFNGVAPFLAMSYA